MATSEEPSSNLFSSRSRNTASPNLELFACLWLDEEVDLTDENCVTQQELRRVINHLVTFKDEVQCEQYIRNATREKLILIVSGKLGREIVPRLHDLPQFSACYVFCANKKNHKAWADHYLKVKGVCIERSELLSKITQDQIDRAKTEEGALISVLNHSSQSLQERNAIFMWFQLYIEVLLRMHHKLSDRQELIDLCKKIYKDNDEEMKMITEFDKTYKAEHAILWYTRESCFYRIMNKALRFQDFDTLFAFRFFITDIAKQIKTEHEKYLRTTVTRHLISVYRGQAIGIDELELMKKSQKDFLSMNSFFSTSRNRMTALCFARSITITDKMQRILFEIVVNPQLQTKAFANITEMSYFHQEDEILIMLGALFRIEEVIEDKTNQMWTARLSLASEDDYKLRETFAHMKEKIGEETNLASLGKILFEMGEYDQVEKCYEHMMHDAQLDLSAAHSGLSKAAVGKQNFDRALNYEKQALKIKRKILPEHHTDLGVSYSRIGSIYSEQKDYDQALTYLGQAVTIQEESLAPDSLILAKTYERIAIIHDQLNEYEVALEYYRKTLDIRRAKLPSEDPSIASTYGNIGNLYRNQKDFDEALKFYRKSLKIYKRILPPTNKKISKVEENIRSVTIQMKK